MKISRTEPIEAIKVASEDEAGVLKFLGNDACYVVKSEGPKGVFLWVKFKGADGEEKVATEGMYVVRYTDGLRVVDPIMFSLMFVEVR